MTIRYCKLCTFLVYWPHQNICNFFIETYVFNYKHIDNAIRIRMSDLLLKLQLFEVRIAHGLKWRCSLEGSAKNRR